LRSKKDLDGAISCYREAIRLEPKSVSAHYNLGKALRDKADLDGAVAAYREVIRLDPKHAHAHYQLGMALRAKNDLESAVAEYREAIRLDPKFALPHNDLAWVLATDPEGLRDGKQAVEHATKACELTHWTSPYCLDTLAVAYAEFGDFDKAIEFQKQALAFPDFEKEHGTRARKQLALYEEKKPYRDPALSRKPPLAPPPREMKR
jgi:tetratricopeptide (TPR) repeat protein